MPWQSSRCPLWNLTCADTTGLSHLDRAVQGADSVANEAEQNKRQKYSSLPATYFVPYAVETLGDEAAAFTVELRPRIASHNGTAVNLLRDAAT